MGQDYENNFKPNQESVRKTIGQLAADEGFIRPARMGACDRDVEHNSIITPSALNEAAQDLNFMSVGGDFHSDISRNG